jgi:hypothetical protein
MRRWGGEKGEFCSGSGSRDDEILSAYVSVISKKASTEGFHRSTFVDLGCGDFRVGEKLLSLCSEYIGVDVVRKLILRNQEKFGNATTSFVHLDIINDKLPNGDVCFVRQVFQHLSNSQISSVLGKLNTYKWVFITEHYPTDNDAITPNIDKIHGADIRLDSNSGVYLSLPPFELPERSIEEILEVPGAGMGQECDQGVIRTFLYKPGN